VADVDGSVAAAAPSNPLGSLPTLEVTGAGVAAEAFLVGGGLASAGPYAFDVRGGGATQLRRYAIPRGDVVVGAGAGVEVGGAARGAA